MIWSLLVRRVTIFLLALLPAIVYSQVIDESTGWNTHFVSSIGEIGSDFYAQSFYADVNTITKFGVVIREIDAEGEVILSIAADNGSGAPNLSSLLYQGTLINPSLTSDWFYETGININVVVGQKYWIVIDGYDNAGATGRSGIGRSDSYTDTGETMIYSNAGGAGTWTSLPNMPLAIYVEGIKPATVDENNGWNNNYVTSLGAIGSDFYAQSFYASVDLITRFGVVIKEIDSEGQIILSIAGDNGSGEPNVSAPLYQGELKNPSAAGGWFYETSLSIPVTVGQKYWILLDGYNNAGATGRSAIGLSGSYTDTGEGMLYSNSGGSSWSAIPTMPIATYIEGINTAIIDENNGFNTSYVTSVGATGSDFYAQSFFADVDVIKNFGAFLGEIDPGGEVRLAIAADNGSGYPDITTPLYQSALLNPPPSGAWFYETGISVNVTVGTRYWVVIDGYDNPGATGRSGVGASGSFTDTDEGMMYSNTGGTGSWSIIPTFPIAIFVDGQLSSLIVTDTTVGSGATACFDATGTITVGEGTGPVVFSSGSTVDLIAGQSIHLVPGFHASSGSNVHAYITLNSNYCSMSPGMDAPGDSYGNTDLSTISALTADPAVDQRLKVFPNPNAGIFTVEVKNLETQVNMTISNSMGEVVLQKDLVNGKITQFDLSYLRKGLYIIRVNDGISVLSQKMIIR